MYKNEDNSFVAAESRLANCSIASQFRKICGKS